MQKIINNKQNLTAGKGFLGLSNSNLFNLAMLGNILSSVITSTTDMISQDIYNQNPNPKYAPNSFSWSHSNVRFSPQLGKSSFSTLGGW